VETVTKQMIETVSRRAAAMGEAGELVENEFGLAYLWSQEYGWNFDGMTARQQSRVANAIKRAWKEATTARVMAFFAKRDKERTR